MIGVACVFFLIVAVPLVMDVRWWYVAAMLAVWAGALALAIRWFVRRPRALVPMALLLAAAWFVAVLAGAQAGWVTAS